MPKANRGWILARAASTISVTLIVAGLVAACGSARPSAGPIQPSTSMESPPGPSASGQAIAPFTGSVALANDRTIPYAGPRPDLATLLRRNQHGNPPISFDPSAGAHDWRLAHPSPDVTGYAGSTSVVPGGALDLHLRSLAGPVRLDIFRMGSNDAVLVDSIARVPAGPQPLARPDPATGLVEERWPVSATLAIPTTWRSGIYLVKLTTASREQGYVLFVVRPATPQPVLVILPLMTYQAYNAFGGADLYGWPGGPRSRGYLVSFDRPYAQENGAGQFFQFDFPLIVWLEDHGYAPVYATDADVAADRALVTEAKAVIVSGHSEYWTAGIRDAFDQAAVSGTSLLNFGANTAWWQARLASDSSGVPDRTIVEYRDPGPDPLAPQNPEGATTKFTNLPRPRPARDLFGEAYNGIVAGLNPMVLGPSIAQFAPTTGLTPGEQLPGLVGGEIDAPSTQPGALILASTWVRLTSSTLRQAGASIWLTPSGSHAFDAGTFDWSWGLDPRYAEALPGFPAAAFERLTAIILAWAGVRPSG